MTFLAQPRLWLLVGVALLLIIYVVAQRRRRRYAVRFTNLALLDAVAPERPGWRRHAPAVLPRRRVIHFVELPPGAFQPFREQCLSHGYRRRVAERGRAIFQACRHTRIPANGFGDLPGKLLDAFRALELIAELFVKGDALQLITHDLELLLLVGRVVGLGGRAVALDAPRENSASVLERWASILRRSTVRNFAA